MAERDRAPIWIYPRRIKIRLLNHGQRLRRERLIQFNHCHVAQRQSRQLQRLRNRIDWTDAKLLRRAAGSCIGNKSHLRFQAKLRGLGITHDHHRRGSIAHGRAVSRGHRAFHMKRGLQPSQHFH